MKTVITATDVYDWGWALEQSKMSLPVILLRICNDDLIVRHWNRDFYAVHLWVAESRFTEAIHCMAGATTGALHSEVG